MKISKPVVTAAQHSKHATAPAAPHAPSHVKAPATPASRDVFQSSGPSAVKPRPPAPQEVGTLKFGADWSETLGGTLQAGGKLTLEYDPARAAERHTHNGFPAWGVTAFVKFNPSGAVVEKPAIEFESLFGRPSNNAKPAKVTVDVPQDAASVEIWFRNWTGADHPSEHWDSNYSSNYRFDVKAKDAPAE